MAYENTFNQDLAKKLIEAERLGLTKKVLDQELKNIKERALILDEARREMAQGYQIMLKALSKAYPALDLNDPNLVGTPDRMARATLEICSGLGVEEKEIFSTSFPSGNYNEMVMLKNIEYNSLCSHHFFPFSGVAHIGYIPGDEEVKEGKKEGEEGGNRVVGLSKLARIVDAYAQRPQLQERLCMEIMEAIKREMKPHGVMVVFEGKHGCLSCRGAKKTNALMITSAVDGCFKNSTKLRSEFLDLLKMRQS